MNLYFLVEGFRTEAIVYPAWLQYLLPLHTRVEAPDEADKNSYFLISGDGYPRLLDEALPRSLADLHDSNKYEYFIICLDADDDNAVDRMQEVQTEVAACDPGLSGFTTLRVIVQVRCFESWFLGNRPVFPRNPQCRTLREYIDFYNVHDLCPENMNCHPSCRTVGDFHHEYLRRILWERNTTYSKRHPGPVQTEPYLTQLIQRIQTTQHLPSFRAFIDLCDNIRRFSPEYQQTSDTPISGSLPTS
jgi:hypothetical protein